MWPGFHGNQGGDFDKFCGYWRDPNKCLTTATRYQFFKKISLCWKLLRNSFLGIICLNFTFSTIFLVNNSHRTIKVHVNKVQYCRAGHIWCAIPVDHMQRALQPPPPLPTPNGTASLKVGTLNKTTEPRCCATTALSHCPCWFTAPCFLRYQRVAYC